MLGKITAAVSVAAVFGAAGLLTAADADHGAPQAVGPSAVATRIVAHPGPAGTRSPTSAPAVTTASAPPAVTTSVPPAVTTGPTPSTAVTPVVPVAPPAGRPTGKVIYLTFDDGPDPLWTPKILRVLTENHATATFFDIGENVVGRAYLIAMIRAQGSQVGNHTWDHSDLATLSDSAVTRELDRTDRIQGAARCVRPPYGATNNRVDALIKARGQRVELWNVDTRDWARPGVAAIERQLLGAQDGATVLMHTGGGDRSETVAALRDALPQLRAKGFALQGIPGC